jgi:hypothetical protein
MSISTSEAQEHLDKMSESNMNSIRELIRNRPPINPYVFCIGYLYFFKGEMLVGVKINEQNGVFVLLFDKQIIKFDRKSGNCIIVSFSGNCFEYFCIGHHYLNATPMVLCGFLYRLLTRQRIDRVGGRSIHSLRFFFTLTGVFGHIERTGASTLIPPTNSLSLHEMICFIKEFLMVGIRSSFLRSRFLQQLPVLGQHQFPHTVAGNYSIRLFYCSTFDRRTFPSVGMISILAMRLFQFDQITRTNQNRIEMRFLEKMFGSILKRILLTFTQNPIGLRQATDQIDNLLASYRMRARLGSSGLPTSITDCVQNMSLMVDRRNEVCQHRFETEFNQAPDSKRLKRKE